MTTQEKIQFLNRLADEIANEIEEKARLAENLGHDAMSRMLLETDSPHFREIHQNLSRPSMGLMPAIIQRLNIIDEWYY